MIDEPAIRECARELFLRHGVGAWLIAAQCADHLLDQGDVEGYLLFSRIGRWANHLADLDPLLTIH